MEKKEKEEEK